MHLNAHSRGLYLLATLAIVALAIVDLAETRLASQELALLLIGALPVAVFAILALWPEQP